MLPCILQYDGANLMTIVLDEPTHYLTSVISEVASIVKYLSVPRSFWRDALVTGCRMAVHQQMSTDAFIHGGTATSAGSLCRNTSTFTQGIYVDTMSNKPAIIYHTVNDHANGEIPKMLTGTDEVPVGERRNTLSEHGPQRHDNWRMWWTGRAKTLSTTGW